MLQVYSDVIQFQGNHYYFGYMQGELLKNSPILSNRKKQWFSKRSRHFIIDMPAFRSVIHEFAPAIWDEIHGLADALEMEIEDAIREFGGYYLEYGNSGCSIFSSSNYLIRNYDNAPLSYDGRYVIYKPTDAGYAAVGPSMQITGRTDGMNEKGLVMGYNFINRRQSDDGFVCNMIGRIILESCSDNEEAVLLLKEIPHRHSFSYVLLDKSGETLIVEASPRKVAVRKSTICTNHFQILQEENRYRMDDSLRRYDAISQQQNSATNSFKAFRMMNDLDKEIFSTNYGAWSGTLHTAIYYPKELKVGITLGGDRLPLIFDVTTWLHGEKFKIKQIKGQLKTHTPFVNMVRL